MSKKAKLKQLTVRCTNGDKVRIVAHPGGEVMLWVICREKGASDSFLFTAYERNRLRDALYLPKPKKKVER